MALYELDVDDDDGNAVAYRVFGTLATAREAVTIYVTDDGDCLLHDAARRQVASTTTEQIRERYGDDAYAATMAALDSAPGVTSPLDRASSGEYAVRRGAAMPGWTFAGRIAIDSGSCWIGDPSVSPPKNLGTESR